MQYPLTHTTKRNGNTFRTICQNPLCVRIGHHYNSIAKRQSKLLANSTGTNALRSVFGLLTNSIYLIELAHTTIGCRQVLLAWIHDKINYSQNNQELSSFCCT